MNSNNKVVYDFTQTNSQQDIAVMPSSIAQRALKALAEQCSKTSVMDIMGEHVNELIQLAKNPETYEAFVGRSKVFVQERELMDNIQAGNWDAYKVEQPK